MPHSGKSGHGKKSKVMVKCEWCEQEVKASKLKHHHKVCPCKDRRHKSSRKRQANK